MIEIDILYSLALNTMTMTFSTLFSFSLFDVCVVKVVLLP